MSMKFKTDKGILKKRGIFNREASNKGSQRCGREEGKEWGTNPCGEIILRPYQFCNLTEAVIKEDDSGVGFMSFWFYPFMITLGISTGMFVYNLVMYLVFG